VLANPLGELSSRLAEYHKALYFAEEELSEDRMNKIQRLQRGLQTIHELQKRTQAGFPVRADEIPPPVTIPGDDEFDLDAVSTLESRLAHYNALLRFESQGQGERKRIPKIQSAIRTVEFLLTRAKARRPVWKKDIPPEFEYTLLHAAQSKGQPVNKAKLTLQLRSLQKRVNTISFKDEQSKKHLDTLKHVDRAFFLSGNNPEETNLTEISLDLFAVAEKTKDLDRREEDLSLIETRLTEYKAAVLASKQDGQVKDAIKHFKVLKGLQALKEALEREETVDMTLVPPPPRDFTPTSESLPSLTDLNQTLATKDVSQNSSGATAHLSPVFIKPAVETAEDKLAKKLFSYLDKGADSNLPMSKQMLNINNISTAPVQYLPKVQNTNARNDGLVASSSSNEASIDQMVSVGDTDRMDSINDTMTGNKPDGIEKVEAERSLTGYEGSFYSLDSQAVVHDQHVISQVADEHQDQRSKGNEQEEENKSNQSNEVVASERDTPNPPLPKSSDIYLRKTLDSVGFLSCQNVPDLSTSVNTVFESSNSKVNDHIQSELGTAKQISSEVNLETVEQQDSEANLHMNNRSLNVDEGTHADSAFGFNHVDLPSHEFSSLNQPLEASEQNTIAVNVSSQNSNTQSTEFPGKQSDIFESAQDTSNERNNDASSHGTLPELNFDVDTQNMTIGHSGYSDTSMPEVLAYVSSDKDLQLPLHSLSGAFIPDIVRSDTSLAADVDTSQSNSNIRNVGQLVASDEDGLEMDQAASLTTGRNDVPDADAAATQDRNGKSSPDTLEFLDLMDSMAMPTAAEPVSFPYFSSSDVALSLSRQSEPVLSTQKPDVLLKENPTSTEVVAHNTENDNMEFQAVRENGQSSQAAVVSSSSGLYVDQADNIVVLDKDKLNKPYTSSVITESNHFSQNHQKISFSLSNSREDTAVFLSNNNTTLESSSQSQTPHNGLSENLTATTSKNQLGNNFTRAVGSHSHVAFTCLENLKYDCLLSLSKESLLEEKKLKIKFEQIKNKLRNGGKRTWEVYKACVEREHASLIQQIEDLRLLQQWSDVQLLSEKKNIAERELAILKSRVPELKY
ncbi:unnamed protein product, partial [Candidula unifasciata]